MPACDVSGRSFAAQLGRVAGLQFVQVLAPWLGPDRAQFPRRMTFQGSGHGSMVAGMGGSDRRRVAACDAQPRGPVCPRRPRDFSMPDRPRSCRCGGDIASIRLGRLQSSHLTLTPAASSRNRRVSISCHEWESARLGSAVPRHAATSSPVIRRDPGRSGLASCIFSIQVMQRSAANSATDEG